MTNCGDLNTKKGWIKPNEVLKESDGVVALCDRCIVIWKYGEQPKEMSFYEAQYFIDVFTRKVKSNDPITAIYGSIWIGAKLQPVAKMNGKGEWELL